MSLNPANGLFVAQTLAKLNRVDSVVPLSCQPFCSELLVRCHTDKEVHSASQYLMEALKRDFVDELENCNGTPNLLPPPARVISALFREGPRDLIEEVEISEVDWQAFGHIFLHDEEPFVESLFRRVGELMGVGDFLFEVPARGSLILRFLPPAVFWGALRVFDLQLISEPDTETRRPLRLDVLPYEVHGRKDMHPYVGALYDLSRIL